MLKVQKNWLKWFDYISVTLSGTLGWQCTSTFRTPITFNGLTARPPPSSALFGKSPPSAFSAKGLGESNTKGGA